MILTLKWENLYWFRERDVKLCWKTVWNNHKSWWRFRLLINTYFGRKKTPLGMKILLPLQITPTNISSRTIFFVNISCHDCGHKVFLWTANITVARGGVGGSDVYFEIIIGGKVLNLPNGKLRYDTIQIRPGWLPFSLFPLCVLFQNAINKRYDNVGCN